VTGYTAKVDAINAAQFESDELIELAWQLGREARELGIEEQPPLRSWEDVGGWDRCGSLIRHFQETKMGGLPGPGAGFFSAMENFLLDPPRMGSNCL
jgi:hypothetical protein